MAFNVYVQRDRIVAMLTEILEPFIRHFRQRLLTEGCLPTPRRSTCPITS